MSAPKLTIGESSQQPVQPLPPPPPPPPPPPLSSLPTSFFTAVTSSLSSQISSNRQHYHHSQSSHLADLELLATSSTPIQERKQQLYNHQQQKQQKQQQQQQQLQQQQSQLSPEPSCSSPAFDSHTRNHHQQSQGPALQSPSKLMQNELRRSRHCATNVRGLSSDASIASQEGFSACPTVSGTAVALPAHYSSPSRQLPPGNSNNNRTQYQQNVQPIITAISSGQHHRCNKHRITPRTSATPVIIKSSPSFSLSSALENGGGRALQSPAHASGTAHTSVFDGSKKSRCILFSQIYLIAHVSITLCLSEIKDATPANQPASLTAKELILDAYLAYILVVALIFFFLLRCYATPSELNDRHFNELTEQSPILYGATLLGLSELTLSGIRILNCLETEFVILPLLKFLFSCFLMHFLLTQIIHSDYIGLRNIAIAHLLATQLSLWILSLQSIESVHDERLCNFTFDIRRFRLIQSISSHNETLQSRGLSANSSSDDPSALLLLQSPEGGNGSTIIQEASKVTGGGAAFFTLLQSLLTILTHQFKLLTIFILITMWFTNNQSKINFIRAKLSDEEVIRASSLRPEKRRFLLKGFAIGVFFFALAIVTVVMPEHAELRHCSVIAIQFLITFISLSGLVIRRRKKYLNPKYQINVLKHHFIIFFTLFATYVTCFINIVLLFQQQWSSSSSFFTSSTSTTTAKVPKSSSSVSSDQLLTILSLLSWSTLLLQVTVQTYLLRLQGKKLVDMSHIFALLVTANLSLWIMDVSSALEGSTSSSVRQFNNFTSSGSSSITTALPISTTTTSTTSATAIHRILTMFVTLNRYYCALIFVHFWKMRI